MLIDVKIYSKDNIGYFRPLSPVTVHVAFTYFEQNTFQTTPL